MKQKTQMSSLINIITVILVIGAVAWGVVKIRSQWAGANPDTTTHVDEDQPEPESTTPETTPKETAAVKEEYTPAENVAEVVAEVEEETEVDTPPQDQTDEPEPEPEPELEPEPEPEPDKLTDETAKEPQRPFDMRKMWNDLNLTPAEQARISQGFTLAMQRWQNMPPEVRQAETARLQAMRVRFEAMAPDEQEQAMQRMMGRFEQWRQSDSIELPELSLD